MSALDQLLAFFGMLTAAALLFGVVALVVGGGAWILDRLRERDEYRAAAFADALRRPDVLCSVSRGCHR